MEREQIKKALECCGTSDKSCSSCPLAKDYSPCSKTMADNALALINSQEQRIKELTEENERLKVICDMKECVIENAESVIARTKADTVRKMQELIYERLDISVEGYSSEEIKSDVRDMVYQIAKEMLEGEK